MLVAETGLSRRTVSYALINLRLKRVIKMRRRRVNPRWDKPHFIALNSNVKTWKPKACSAQWKKLRKFRPGQLKTLVGVQGVNPRKNLHTLGVQALAQEEYLRTPKVRGAKNPRNLSFHEKTPAPQQKSAANAAPKDEEQSSSEYSQKKPTPANPPTQKATPTTPNTTKRKKVFKGTLTQKEKSSRHKPIQDRGITPEEEGTNQQARDFLFAEVLRHHPLLRESLQKILNRGE